MHIKAGALAGKKKKHRQLSAEGGWCMDSDNNISNNGIPPNAIIFTLSEMRYSLIM